MASGRRWWGVLLVLSLLALVVAPFLYTKTEERLTFWGVVTGVIAIWSVAFWWAGRDPTGGRTRVAAAILGICGGLIVGALLAGVASVFMLSASCEEDIDCAMGIGALLPLIPIGAVFGAILGGWLGYLLARRLQRGGTRAPEAEPPPPLEPGPGLYDLILTSPGRRTVAVWRILRRVDVPDEDIVRALENPPATVLRGASYPAAERVRVFLIREGATVEMLKAGDHSLPTDLQPP